MLKVVRKLIISLLVILLLLPILIPIILINELIRLLLSIFCVDLFSGPDGVFSYTDRCICRFVCEYPKDSFDFDTFKQTVYQSIVKPHYSRLSKYPSSFLGYRCWKKDPSFSPSAHFRTLDKRLETEEDYESELEKLGEPFVLGDKPQWEFIHIPVFPGGETSGFILRYNHPYGDGASFFAALTGGIEDAPFYFHPYKDPSPSILHKLLFYFKECFFLGYGVSQLILRNKSTSALPCGPLSSRRHFHVKRFSIPLERLKTISRRNYNASFNSIVLSVFEKSLKGISVDLDLCRVVLLGGFPYNKGRLENRLSLLAVTKENINVQDLSRETKILQNDTFLAGKLLHPFVLGRLPIWMNQAFSLKFKNGLIANNLPISKETMNLAGFPVERCCAHTNAYNAINVTLISYKDDVNVAVTSAATMLNRDELDRLISKVKDVLDAM